MPADLDAGTGPDITWFEGGKLNVAHNCVDRHVDAGRGGKVALHFEGEPGDRRSITYAELQREVSKAANALLDLGITKGDRVVIYLPVIPETVIITLAVARIGAIHSLVFGGFSAEALKFRVEDTGAKLLVTTDGQFRRGTAVPVKDNADAAVSGDNSIEHVLVVNRTTAPDLLDTVPMTAGRDVWWHDAVGQASDSTTPEPFDAETPLFIMYTSGTTGKPKGLVHTSGGYLTQASWSFEHLFSNPDPDLRDQDVHWCTADLAWVTAHTYEIYGPLSNGVTQVIFEGTPEHPAPGPAFRDHRTLRGHAVLHGPDPGPVPHGLVPGRRPGHLGPLLHQDARHRRRSRQPRGLALAAEQRRRRDRPGGGHLVAVRDGRHHPLPRADGHRVQAGLRGAPAAGRQHPHRGRRRQHGSARRPGLHCGGLPGPAIARTVWGNPRRYFDSYWRKYAGQGWFLAGDGAKYDDDGDIWILGRVDDTLNVSGHLLSTIEIESALVSHPDVVEAGVCPVTDATTGHAIVAFVVLKRTAGAEGIHGPAQGPRREGDRPDREAAGRRRRSRCAEDAQRQDHAQAAHPAVRRNSARGHHLAPERTIHRGHPGCPAVPYSPGSKGTP